VAMPTALVLSWFEARMDADRVLTQKALRTILAPTGHHVPEGPVPEAAHA